MKNLKGKVAVITGGAEGIGKALAVLAASQGMKLVLADIDAARLDATVAAFTAQGIEAIGVRTDVSKADQVDHLAELAFERFSNVHLLCNNAGVACAKPVWETTPGDWEWVVGVNLYGVANGLRSFIPRMLANGEEGHIVNTASIAGLISSPSLAAYNATKHAVVTLTEGLHHDLKLRNAKIKASVLCPAWVKTRISASERNRTAGEAFDASKLDPVTLRIGGAIQQAVADGIAAEKVARDVFDAIDSEHFYILTHPDSAAAVRIRMEDILEDRAPTMLR
ncbi:MAG: SDR family NAD(P)-dependent oxidoreductase [Rhodoferax sp.]|uniref:SDR family NAD(P)-dependent oxidoreductase n=1 Tax=Rhodoferax sp. TaxID=50421 RepID=UPI001B6D0A95|nr:SDR family NAD(P)-dependent oxidoreductase [Rhodoferax sp.]MBP9906714.1 SDR family NAD(P)-dependent oxidoreductase [Rhodoferax sp.]